jgi:tetratricopeptide (TPR) repeat protein
MRLQTADPGVDGATLMKRLIVGAALIGATLAFASAASAAVTVIGGGLAEACANAAITGKSDFRFETLCTQALSNEMLNSRDRAGTYVNRGVMKLRRANFDAAIVDFNQAVRIKPDMGEIYINRGAASIGQHRYAEGMSDLNKSLELGVDEPAKAYYNRALAYEGLDDAKSAYFDYQKALELSPDWNAPKEQLVRFKVTRKE